MLTDRAAFIECADTGCWYSRPGFRDAALVVLAAPAVLVAPVVLVVLIVLVLGPLRVLGVLLVRVV